MIKLLAFDFDGTLADTKPLLLGMIKKELEKRGYKLNKRFIHEFGDKPLQSALELLKIHEKVLPFLDKELHEEFKFLVKKIKLAHNIKKLEQIQEEKIIISNSIAPLIKKVMINHKLSNLFSQISGEINCKSKKEIFSEIIKKRKLKPREIVYIGDRPIDSKLAREIGCVSVIVSNSTSWSPLNDVLRAKPDFIIKDISELKSIVDRLNSK